MAKVIEVLNKARSMELYAVHQYMNQHYNLDDLDYGEFASKIKLIAIDEIAPCRTVCRAHQGIGRRAEQRAVFQDHESRRLWTYSPST